MSTRDLMTIARDVVANIAVAGALAAGAAVASSATAAADPPPPPPAPPVPIPPPAPPVPQGPPVPMLGAPLGPNGLSPLAQSGVPAAGPFGIPDPTTGSEYLLGQNPAPAAPGGPPGAPPPNLSAFNNAYLLPQNEVPSAPGEGTLFGVATGQESANLSGLDYIKRWWHLYQDDRLKGSLLGQVPQDQLGAPLPGTAPPPGTSLPPGLTPPEPPVVPTPAVVPPGPEAPPPPPAG